MAGPNRQREPILRPVYRVEQGGETGRIWHEVGHRRCGQMEHHFFDTYNEATILKEMIVDFHKREGPLSTRMLADKIYQNLDSLAIAGNTLSGSLARLWGGEKRTRFGIRQGTTWMSVNV